MNALEINDAIVIPMNEIEESAVRSQGAGGQNVNKVATAIQLRFDIHASDSLPENVVDRLLARSDQRITSDGVIVIKAQRHRTQRANREDALERLAELIREATIVEKPRVKTRPGRKAKEKRLQEKRNRASVKQKRSRPDLAE